MLAALERRRASGQRVVRREAGGAAAAQAQAWGCTRAVVADEPWLDALGVPEALTGAGLEVVRWPAGRGWEELLGLSGPALTCGVTVPVWGVAGRGTVAIEPGATHGRSIDVVCSHHLAVMPADRLVQTLGEGLARSFRAGRPPASAVSLVSGPSRSSDIEKISTLGAHGAYAEHVLLVDES
jgi:L-lactate dehydrogenase complex protein LldG